MTFFPALTLFTQYPEELADRTEVAQNFFTTTGASRLGIEIHPPPESFTPSGIENTRRLLETYEQGISANFAVTFRRTMHFPFLPYDAYNIGDLDQKKRKRTIDLLKKGAKFAAALNIPVVNTHFNTTCTDQEWRDTFHHENTRQKVLENAVDSLQHAVPAYEEAGVFLALENTPYPFESISRTPPISPYAGVVRQDFDFVFDQIHENALSFCYDVLHANILSTTAKVFVQEKLNFAQYWGMYPSQESEFRQIAAEGLLYQLRNYEQKTSHIHLGGQLGSYRPGNNTIVEGSVLDLSNTKLIDGYRSAFRIIAEQSRFPEISMVIEVKEEDYHHSLNLAPSLVACWQLIQELS